MWCCTAACNRPRCFGDEFYTKIGVNEWADTNRIVVLYPQAHATDVSELASQNFLSLFNTNLQGCWNWWGYAGDKQFMTKQGVQLGVDHRRVIALGTHLAGSERVMDANAGRPDMRVDLLVRDFAGPRRDLARDKRA
jgi:hypothetical protein